ncbi:hypothetical protein [Lactococcus lactis]|uniref:hypothetical protein n=1 Tax=Lactococcus lactis TaxID=1358 RepID=UPI002046A2C4|nr:hypothetical protein LLID5_05200 [Lactococcus lactis]
MNELQNFTNGIFNLDIKVDGENILFSAEQAAKAMGITQVKNGKEYVKWERVNSYLPNSPEAGKAHSSVNLWYTNLLSKQTILYLKNSQIGWLLRSFQQSASRERI